MGESFNSFSDFLKNKFPGHKILKIPINAGFSCPNRDGLFSRNGCVFCDRYASGPIHTASWPIKKQMNHISAAIRKKSTSPIFIALQHVRITPRITTKI